MAEQTRDISSYQLYQLDLLVSPFISIKIHLFIPQHSTLRQETSNSRTSSYSSQGKMEAHNRSPIVAFSFLLIILALTSNTASILADARRLLDTTVPILPADDVPSVPNTDSGITSIPINLPLPQIQTIPLPIPTFPTTITTLPFFPNFPWPSKPRYCTLMHDSNQY